MKRSFRNLQLESLQPRDLMAVDSAAWNDASSLRLSFVPDGTEVSKYHSNLAATLSSSPAGAAWRESIAQAFQIWSQYAAINVGIVSDNGAALGAAGPTHGDDRFGDIRVAGIPMSDDTWAASISQDRLAAGSWSGDLLFNTQSNWNLNQDDLLRVALHEAGHVLGLPHNDDPDSPMHTHGVPTSLVPDAADIALLRTMYGVRGPDANEINKANDTMGDATRIRFSDNLSNFDGTKPLVHYGEIASTTDRDIFFYVAPSTTSGPTSFRIASAGLSQLQYKVTLMDKNGVALATGHSNAALGGDLTLTLPNVVSGQKIYIQIEGEGATQSKIGSYAVVVTLDNKIAYTSTEILSAVQRANRWFASSAQSLTKFNVTSLLRSTGAPLLNYDQGGDDNPLDASRVDPFMDTAVRRAAKVIGTISASSDSDSYRFRSPSLTTGEVRGMLVEVDSLELDGLVPVVTVLDTKQHVVPAKQLVNGNGQVRLWLPQIVSNTDYTVRIAARVAQSARGNYEITVSFQATQPELKTLVERDIAAGNSEVQSVWYVARPQLFSLALQASGTSNTGDIAWANIYNDKLRPVYTLVAGVGELRTGPAVLLEPGTYYLQFGTRSPSNTPSNVHVALLGSPFSNPIGPEAVSPTSTPIFNCPVEIDLYCYPDNVSSADPFVIVPDNTLPLPTADAEPIFIPADEGFWPDTFIWTNPVESVDVSGDGNVTPYDLLILLNNLNSDGPGLLPAPPVVPIAMYDVNNDGYETPLDVLLVVNFLNQSSSSEGEGWGGSDVELAPNVIVFDAAPAGVASPAVCDGGDNSEDPLQRRRRKSS